MKKSGNMEEIARIAREAEKLGLTYGEYVARQKRPAQMEAVKKQQKRTTAAMKMIEKRCAMCGKPFQIVMTGQGNCAARKYCGAECKNAAALEYDRKSRERCAERKREGLKGFKRTCAMCGAEFESRYKKLYCSPECLKKADAMHSKARRERAKQNAD